MSFKTTSGVFEPTSEALPTKKKDKHTIRGGGFNSRPLPNLPPDVIGIGCIVLEMILLYIFREGIFYHLIQPFLRGILNLSAFVVGLGSMLLTAVFGIRSMIRKRRRSRDWGWF